MFEDFLISTIHMEYNLQVDCFLNLYIIIYILFSRINTYKYKILYKNFYHIKIFIYLYIFII